MASLHDDALVIIDDIENFNVKRVLIDGDSVTNVLTWEAFVGFKISLKRLIVVSISFKGFREATVIPE